MPLPFLQRHPRLIAFVYLVAVPAAIVVILVLGAIETFARRDADRRQTRQATAIACAIVSFIEMSVGSNPDPRQGTVAALIKLEGKLSRAGACDHVQTDSPTRKGTP